MRAGIVSVALILIAGAVYQARPWMPPAAAPVAAAADPAVERRFEVARLIARGIAANLNDRASIQWSDLYANADASVICAEFRARNAFGALVVKRVSVANGAMSDDVGAWNKHCTGNGFFDEKNAFAFL